MTRQLFFFKIGIALQVSALIHYTEHLVLPHLPATPRDDRFGNLSLNLDHEVL